LFLATLDFGGVFGGLDYWLEIGMPTNGGTFTILSPRQHVTPTPYAIAANSLSGNLPASQLTGTLPGIFRSACRCSRARWSPSFSLSAQWDTLKRGLQLSPRAALAVSGALPENVNYAVKSSYLLGFLESVPEVSAKLKEPETKERKFEDVVKAAEQAAVRVLAY